MNWIKGILWRKRKGDPPEDAAQLKRLDEARKALDALTPTVLINWAQVHRSLIRLKRKAGETLND